MGPFAADSPDVGYWFGDGYSPDAGISSPRLPLRQPRTRAILPAMALTLTHRSLPEPHTAALLTEV